MIKLSSLLESLKIAHIGASIVPLPKFVGIRKNRDIMSDFEIKVLSNYMISHFI